MKRIGILGTENSHAKAFTRIFNLPDGNGNYRYPDFRVTTLYALERKPSDDIIADVGGDIEIVESPEKMAAKVDCAMITARHGKYHAAFALPFIERGMPVFIDKPFTVDANEARALLEKAALSGAPVSGGSGCKYSRELLELKNDLQSGKAGRVLSAVINFPADMESVYGGFYFYASHLIEMTTELFGDGIISVTAFDNGGKLLSVASYDDLDVVMNFAKCKSYRAVVYGEEGIIVKELTTDKIYEAEADVFARMARSGRAPYPDKKLLTPVLVMNAIEKSLKGKRRVYLNEL